MTLALERTEARADVECTATRHGATAHAYRVNKCRCPAALAAHAEYRASTNAKEQAARRGDRSRGKAAWINNQTNPDCPAERHTGSANAWRAGCRCPEAETAYKRELLTHADPRARWRGPQSRVSTTTLRLLAGLPMLDESTQQRLTADATMQERMLALLRLLDRGHGPEEIAPMFGMTTGGLHSLAQRRDRLREQRTLRRLADAQWRARRAFWLQEKGHAAR